MKATRSLLALLIATLGCTSSEPGQTAPQEQADRLALVGGTLIDGTGQAPVRNSVVLVRGERIERVGTMDSLPVPDGYQRVSTEGMTVLPGLWDPHVHLLYSGHPDFQHWFEQYTLRFEAVTIPVSAEQLLMAGVTSVRDLGAPTEAILAVRERIASGELPGATIYAAGPLIMAEAARAHTLAVSGVPDARAKTRELIEAGVDVIKIAGAEQLQPDEIRAIVEEAHTYGSTVTAHGRSDAEIRLGLAAGVDEFQHIGTRSAEYPDDIVASIRERMGTGPPLYWSLTVSGQFNEADLATDPEFLDDPRGYEGLPDEIAEDVRQAVAEVELEAPNPETLAIVRRKVAQLEELGVDLVFGSDMGTFGAPASQATWREMDVWVRDLGMDPMIVIREATSDAARLVGAERDSGSVSQGKYADLIAVRGNPLRHMDALREPAIIIKHGRRYK